MSINGSIHALNLRKTFNQGKSFALDNVTLSIEAGEFVAIIGLSGAGKSTFLRALNGTTPDLEGKLEVLGQNVVSLRGTELRNLRRKIGFIFQQFNLVKNLSVLQNVLVGRVGYNSSWRSFFGFFPPEDKILAKQTIDAVGLEGRYHDKARQLSGGQQQRVAIARALVQQPKLLLADEPMASLDPKLSELVLQMLAKVNREQGITVLVNIHVLELAKKYAGRVIAFRHGKIVFDGKPEALTEDQIEAIYHLGENDA